MAELNLEEPSTSKQSVDKDMTEKKSSQKKIKLSANVSNSIKVSTATLENVDPKQTSIEKI